MNNSDNLFVQTWYHNKADSLQWILEFENGQYKPRAETLNDIYEKAMNLRIGGYSSEGIVYTTEFKNSVINLLYPLIAPDVREAIDSRANARDFRQRNIYVNNPSTEVHSYSDTAVSIRTSDNLKPSSTSCSTQEREMKMSLDQAIFMNIEERLRKAGVALPSDEVILSELPGIIDASYSKEEDREKAKEIVSYQWDSNTKRRLNLAVTFLRTFHPNSFDSWFKGYVFESFQAYDDEKKTSCFKGIDERIMTGLRGIDADLDIIFSTPERKMLIINFFATLNIGDDSGKARVINALIDAGINASSSIEDVVSKYANFLNNYILSTQGNIDEFRDRIADETGIISEYYESLLKPTLLLKLQERGAQVMSSSQSMNNQSENNLDLTGCVTKNIFFQNDMKKRRK